MMEIILKSILAGVFIGIGDLTFLYIENRIVGAMLFSLGLLTIIKQGLFLYTGKVGYCKNKNDFLRVILIYVFNIVGVYLMMLYAKSALGIEPIEKITNNYINNVNYINYFLQAIYTGALMYVAVDSKTDILTILCVMGFILLGGKHSIAISFFLPVWKYPLLSILFMVGNGIGGQIVDKISGYTNKK